MIRKPEELTALTHELALSVWTSGALGVLLEHGLAEPLREPCSLDELVARCPGASRDVIEACLSVAVSVGVVVREADRYRFAEGAQHLSQVGRRLGLQGELRSNLMQALALMDAPRAGWRHTDPGLLQAQGDNSAGLAPFFAGMIVPGLDGLAARLGRPGGRFLDVGVGVAALSIAMCRVFPELAIVGIDRSPTPLAIARENVAAAGLGARIELREANVEELADEGAYDLAWLPSFFMDKPVVQRIVARLHAAVRPGGWILVGADAAGGDERERAVWSLIATLWGGARLGADGVRSILEGAGFGSVRVLPGPPWAPAMIVGQR